MKLVATVALLVSVLFALPAEAQEACEKGDEVVGPNCVHVDEVPAPKQPQMYSTVYRILAGKKTVVWEGFAVIVKSTPKKLVVSEWSAHERTGVTGLWTVEYTWDGKTYTNRKQLD